MLSQALVLQHRHAKAVKVRIAVKVLQVVQVAQVAQVAQAALLRALVAQEAS